VKKSLLWANGVHKAPTDAAAWWEGDEGSHHTYKIMYCGFLQAALFFWQKAVFSIIIASTPTKYLHHCLRKDTR